MTMKVYFKKNHGDHKKGDIALISRSDAVKLYNQEIIISAATYMAQESERIKAKEAEKEAAAAKKKAEAEKKKADAAAKKKSEAEKKKADAAAKKKVATKKVDERETR